MKLHLIFIGNKFVYNNSLKNYILQNIEEKNEFINSITYFKSSDNSLFLYLERELNSSDKFIIITSKQNFSTVGKLICTATSDNQIVRDNMLIPQKAALSHERSYLLEYKEAIVNVLQMDDGQKMPELLIMSKNTKARIHIFDEERETLINILNPIAQMYEVQFEVIEEVKGWLQVDIFSKKYGDISHFVNGVKKLLPKKLINSSSVVTHIIQRLSSASKKITFSESCTGGLLSYYFTKENGASKILDGSLVTYSNLIKENWLAVTPTSLENYGAVSAEVIEEMSEGAINVSGADFAISISGIAGEGGGTDEKPVGTVYIGVRTKNRHKEEHYHFNGDRNYVQHQSAMSAIKMLLLIDKDTFF
ncbi:CinA family protein [Sulfurimonas sp.]|jgi:nicotinamide-nucleotide amidase|uniref:CinA family protein n=1 Tax=Sulfurimonas sp. TaxID=2022749 RepID=UPI0025D70903|nr:CinA family protein [Sulfurimonas sp.]MBT5934685.1 CinA family protein [Sulfurimonas sp.]